MGSSAHGALPLIPTNGGNSVTFPAAVSMALLASGTLGPRRNMYQEGKSSEKTKGKV